MKFEVGKTYYARSACDYDCIWNFTVISRTDKSVKLQDSEGKTTSRRVKVWSDVETCLPFGSYSMAPCLSAERVAA